MKNRLWTTTVFCLSCLAAFFHSAKAQVEEPAVIGAPSIVQDRQDITITGLHFGAKATAAPLLWEDWEWGSPGDPCGNGGWSVYHDGFGGSTLSPTISTTKKNSGTRSLYAKLLRKDPATSEDDPSDWQGAYKSFSPSLKIYVSFMTYYDSSNIASAWAALKGSGIRSVPVGGGSPYGSGPYMQMSFAAHVGTYYVVRYLSTESKADERATIAAPPAQWNRVEFYFVLSDPPGETNGYADTWVNLQSRSTGWQPWPIQGVTRAAGCTNLLNTFLTGHMWPRPPSPYAEVWVDDIYIDNTLARVEIGDAETWASCTHREVQIPSAWSDTSITFTANQGSFTNGEQVYLYVVDAGGKVNDEGFPITFGQGEEPIADLTPPFVTGQSPAPGGQNVPVNSDIVLHIQDAGDGVDIDSIEVRVNTQPVVAQIKGTPADYTVTYGPGSPLIHGSKVTVTVKAQDLHSPANLMEGVTYSFTTVAGTPGKPDFVD